jgi:hypothetical protein
LNKYSLKAVIKIRVLKIKPWICRFDIPYTDDPEDSKLEVIVQLSQKDARSTLLSDQRQNLVIGFHIMKVEANRRYRVHKVLPIIHNTKTKVTFLMIANRQYCNVIVVHTKLF